MKNATLLRLQNTAKLEKMIEEGCEYEEILNQSKKLDKLIADELKRNIENKRKKQESIDKTKKNH